MSAKDQSLAADSSSPNGPSPDDELWEELLQLIEERRVIPVVGRELLMFEVDGERVLLHQWLAQQLAESLGVRPDEPGKPTSLNAVASRYLADGGEPEKIYNRVHKLLRARSGIPIPEPLKKLASIQPFKLFVSTTFDSLLTQAINAVRFRGVEHTKVVAYSPRDKHDLPPVDPEHLETPVVFHLLGKVSPMQDYVVTEEDALEFIHSLQSSGLPVNLFSALDETPLLIVGCSFPAWLVRFFIRAARRNRLLLARGKTDFVVDTSGRDEPALLSFLRNFKTRTEYFTHADAISFVDELHRRWQARIGEQGTSAPPVAQDLPPMTSGAVFLSYCSDDRPAVEAIRSALDAAGIDVWFDRDQLLAGDLFESKIRRFIERSSLFVPVLSRSCVTPERRFFRLEWEHAQRVAITAPQSSAFILPIVIDDLPPDHEDIPDRFRAVQWQRLSQGQATPEFIDIVKRLYRDYQSRNLGRG